MQKQKREKKSYTFRDGMPEDVYKILIRKQNKIKEQKGTTQYSLERTIYQIIREYAQMLKDKNCPE